MADLLLVYIYIGSMRSLFGVLNQLSAEFSFFYTKRSSLDLYIQTYLELGFSKL